MRFWAHQRPTLTGKNRIRATKLSMCLADLMCHPIEWHNRAMNFPIRLECNTHHLAWAPHHPFTHTYPRSRSVQHKKRLVQWSYTHIWAFTTKRSITKYLPCAEYLPIAHLSSRTPRSSIFHHIGQAQSYNFATNSSAINAIDFENVLFRCW